MKERGILMNGAMVRSTLSGVKTQTRRIIKPQPAEWKARVIDITEPMWCDENQEWGRIETIWNTSTAMWEPDREVWRPLKCPFGVQGDILYVRETWAATGTGVWTIRDARAHIAPDQRILYRADNDEGKWWPSIHMPREFSRITLEITDIRVEKLGSISDADAKEEGCHSREDFIELWKTINKSWTEEEWVWVLVFQMK
jgi:hypothetical protein